MKRIYLRLSHSSIQDCIRQLEEYKDGLLAKQELFCNRLAEKGISIAKVNCGYYAPYIGFSKVVSVGYELTTASIIMFDQTPIMRQWVNLEGLQEVEISPSLFAEFGSGWEDYRGDKYGYGQGSFPGQTHAKDPNGWWYKTVDGEWHHSNGEQPTEPLYNASKEIYMMVNTVAREVFGNG